MKKNMVLGLLIGSLGCNVEQKKEESPLEQPVTPAGLTSCAAPSLTIQGTTLTSTWTKTAAATAYKLDCVHSSGTLSICEGDLDACNYTTFQPGLDYGCQLEATDGETSVECGTRTSFRAIGPFENNNSGSATQSTLTLRWTNAVGANRYKVEEVNASGVLIREVSADATSPLLVQQLTPSTAYYFKVTASNSTNTRVISSPIMLSTTAYVAPLTLLAPVMQSDGNLAFNFQVRSDVTGVSLKQGTVTGVYPTTTSCTTSPCQLSGLTAGTNYFFRLEGLIDGNTAVASTEVAAMPLGPFTDTIAQQTSATSLMLNWNAVVGATSYVVFHGSSANQLSQQHGPTSSNSLLIENLTAGQSIHFRIRASNASLSIESDVETAQLIGGFQFQGVSFTLPESFTYTFTSAPGATYYQIARGVGSNQASVTFTCTSSPCTEYNVTPDIDYNVQITALNEAGGLVASTQQTGRALAAPVLTLAPSGGGLSASWSPVVSGVTYGLRYGTESGVYATTVSTNAASPVSIPSPNLGQAFYVELTATNQTGVVRTDATFARFFTFTPSAASVGSILTFAGVNLDQVTGVTIGGRSAIILSQGSSALKALVMPGTISGNVILTRGSSTQMMTGFTASNPLPPTSQQGSKLVGQNSIGSSNQGYSVALSADGDTALIGGPNDDGGVGAAWFYLRTDQTWAPQGGKRVGTGIVSTGGFGSSVALSADGNTAIIGGMQDESGIGAAWIYTRSGTTWSEQGSKIRGTGRSGNAEMGSAVALSADGNTALLGGKGDESNSGATWVFTRSGTTWSQQGSKWVGTGASGAASQGAAVSLSLDGQMAIVGGPADNSHRGASWIFSRNGNTWSQLGAKLSGSDSGTNSKQGSSVAMDATGQTALVGGKGDQSNVGASWVFVRTNNAWSQQGSKLVGSGSVGAACQGNAVSLSADGNMAMVGGFKDDTSLGAAWYFTRMGNNWTQNGSKIVGTSADTDSEMGVGLGLSANGRTSILGGWGDATDRGSSWIFVTP